MPGALDAIRGGEGGSVPVSPVDMAQAAIGPATGWSDILASSIDNAKSVLLQGELGI